MAHGRIEIDVERCKGCEMCIPACPQDVIILSASLNEKGYRPAEFHDPHGACTGCALCAVVCPDAAITVYRDIPNQRREIVRKEVHYV